MGAKEHSDPPLQIESRNRAFLDSCILKRLARGEWASELATLRRLIDQGRWVLIITPDHLSDYGDCRAESASMSEARFVDTLRPFWMPPGDGIYHREAYSEFLRLTGRQPLREPFPVRTASEALCQWLHDCPCLEESSELAVGFALVDTDPTFSGKLAGGFMADAIHFGPRRGERLGLKAKYAANRAWARDQKFSAVEWDGHFRQRWIKYLTQNPAKPPDADLRSLARQVSFVRMPAWTALMGVEKVWHSSQTAAKPTDAVDARHVALLPYVSAFITEKNLANMIKQAKVSGRTLVTASIAKWLGKA